MEFFLFLQFYILLVFQHKILILKIVILKVCKYFLFVLSFCFASAQVNDVSIDSLIKNEDVRFFQNLEYGDSKRNKLDLLIPKSKIKTPLVIFLHGGGYKGGNKESSYKKNNIIRVRRILRNKIAFATINVLQIMIKPLPPLPP